MPPVTNAAYPYDIDITATGQTYSFMLVSPPQQSKQLQVDEVQTPTGIYELRRINTPETLMHTDFDLKMDVPWAQNTFTMGVGQLEFNEKTDEQQYWWSSGIITHTDAKAYLAKAPTTLAIPSGANAYTNRCSFVTSGGTRYDFMCQGTRLYRRDATLSSNAWAVMYTASAAITNISIINGKLFICVPTVADPTSYYYQSDPTAAAVWVPTAVVSSAMTLALGKPSFFLQVRGTAYAFVQNHRVLYNQTDPTSGSSWLGPIDTTLAVNGANQVSGPPGDTSYPFINVLAMNNYMIAFKMDAGYTIDANQEVREALWEWKQNVAPRNFKYSCTAAGIIYYSQTPEIYAYDPVTGRNLPIGLSTQAGFSVQDILGLDGNDGNIYVLAKVQVPTIRATWSTALLRVWRASAQQWVFEVMWEDTSATSWSGVATVPNGTGTNVYIFSADGTTSRLFYFPPDYDESTQGNFTSTADMFLSFWRTGFPNFQKKWTWLALTADNVDGTGNNIGVYYSLDKGATWTLLRSVTTAGLNFIPMTSITSDGIVVKLTFNSANGTVTPVLRGFDLHGRVRWRYLRQVKVAIRVADYLETLNGGRASGNTDTAAKIKTALETIRVADTYAQYRDFLGNTFQCSIDSISYRPTRHEKPTDQYELEAVVTLSELGSGT